MARKFRVQYPGAIYHVMNRGDRREPIFIDDDDHRCFLATLGEMCVKTGWQVNAQAGDWHYGEELQEAAELKRRKWDAKTLAQQRKGDPAKLAMERRLREKTTMTMERITGRLRTGTKTHRAHLLHWEYQSNEKARYY
jgi:hypothetical protein